jgi:membrane-bound lytic murein transglycosylase D
MQYTKLTLASALYLIAASPLSAQTKTATGMKAFPATAKVEAPAPKGDSVKTVSVPKAISTPTPVVPKVADKTAPATAASGPVQTAMLASNLAPTNGKGYSKVPLAGEKAYFGDKNEYVNDFVRKYLELHNKSLGSVKSNSTKPFNVIDNVLEKKSLPKELKYLAVIESALNHKAVSRAGAVGPWQLMESTARMMGLTVNHKRDERTDWYKSTTAATQYLELLYSQLNDWLLVIAAYNSGPVPVQRAIDRTGSRSFWDIKEYLPRETQGHVLAFIATASIFENLNKFISLGSVPVDFKFGKEEEPAFPVGPKGIAGTKPAPGGVNAATIPAATTAVAGAPAVPATVVKKAVTFTDDELKNMTIVRITDPVHFEVMELELKIDRKLLARWNSDFELFVNKTYPTPHYNLRIPKDKLDEFLVRKDAIIKRSKLAFANNKLQ